VVSEELFEDDSTVLPSEMVAAVVGNSDITKGIK